MKSNMCWFYFEIYFSCFVPFRCVHITDIGVGYISTMLSLTALFLRWCSQVRDFGLQHLCSMRNLQVLSLAGNVIISVSHAIFLLFRWNFHCFMIYWNNLFNECHWIHLLNEKKKLFFYNHLFNEKFFKNKNMFTKPKPWFTVYNFIVFLFLFSNPGCPLLTSSGLSSIIQLRHLQELELTNCPGASQELFEYLREHLPRCLIIE